MKKIPPNRVRSHADFDLTELGKWATGNDATALTARGQRVQRPTSLSLPNPFLSDDFGEVRGSGRFAHSNVTAAPTTAFCK